MTMEVHRSPASLIQHGGAGSGLPLHEREKMDNYRIIIAILALLVAGYGMRALDDMAARQMDPNPAITWSAAFSYSKNGETAFEVKPDGRINFGPAYTERAMQEFFEGLRDAIKSQHQIGAPACVPVIYSNGNMRDVIRP